MIKLRIFSLVLCSLLVLGFQLEAKTKTQGKYYALVIGINTYKGSVWSPLKNAKGDAETLAKLLKTKYQFEEVVELYNNQATRANILQDLAYVTGKLTEDDKLLIFYSGHGFQRDESGAGYWVPSDARTEQAHVLVPNSEVKTALTESRCNNILVIIDACFSATILRHANQKPENYSTDAYYTNVISLKSRQAVTAGGIQPVPDGQGKHSIFAKYLIKYLKQNTKKYYAASELFNHIKMPVYYNTKTEANKEIVPRFGAVSNTGHEGGEFVFVFDREKELENLRKQVRSLQQENSDLKRDKSNQTSLASQMKQLQQENQTLKQQASVGENATRQANTLQQQNEQLQQQVTKQTAVANQARKLQEENERLQRKYRMKQVTSCDFSDTELENIKRDLEYYDTEIEGLKKEKAEEIEALQKKHKSALAEIHFVRARNLHTALGKLKGSERSTARNFYNYAKISYDKAQEYGHSDAKRFRDSLIKQWASKF